MITAAHIFNHIKMVNPQSTAVSSIGSFVSQSQQMVADGMFSDIVTALPEGTLAYKIATSGAATFTDKQLWVIAFELLNNSDYVASVTQFNNEINRKENIKKAKSTAKLNANKEASVDVLAPIKATKRIGEFGKWLNQSGNIYRKQHFTKAYSLDAVAAFLNA